MKYGIGFCIEKRKGNKCQDSPISMNVSVSGKYFRYYTGCRCAVDQWIDKTSDGEHIQQVKRNVTTPRGESFTNINQKLNNLRNEVKSFLDRCDALNVEPNFQTLKSELDNYLNKRAASIEPVGTGFFDRYEQYAKESNVSAGRKNHLQSSINKLKAFRPDTTFKKLDVQYLID